MAEEPGARGAVEVIEPSAAQQEFARRVAESKATIPHAYADIEVETVEEIELPGAIAACARALRDVPALNGAYRDGRFELYSRINIGFAAAAAGTLAFPVIHDADGKSAEEIAADVERLADRVREGAITQPELSGATFSVADAGSHGAGRAFAVVNRGQSAFLTVGGRRQRLGRACLALSYDHRMHQGSDPLAFLARLGELLEAPG